MESQFAHLRQRDTSVSMLRVKMSRRRSQSQKENRERVVNTRRQLDKLPELEMSSFDSANMSVIQQKPQDAKPAKNFAVEERLKQLERWKERKALEKEKRERERKGVFKTGLYHPKDTFAHVTVPVVPAAPKRANETKVNMIPFQNIRVTRSMKQQPQVEKPLKTQDVNAVPKKGQPPVERLTRSRVATVKSAATANQAKVSLARSTNRPPVKAVPVVKDKPREKAADLKTTKSRAVAKPLPPLFGRDRTSKASTINTAQPVDLKEPELKELNMQEPEKNPHAPSLTSCTEKKHIGVGRPPADSVLAGDSEIPNSFAPEGFVFQAPAGLSSFKFEPLTPRSADAFLTPSAEPPTPPKSPAHLSPCASQTVAPALPGSSLESKHDVPYFRAEIANETHRLTVLCVHWESKVEDESIPEEMRGHMRTVVGQARLLMKERFKQFSGLVDDCELGQGEKITTCTDLQGFWDMVYYQVEDVNKKFDSLKEAESRGWVEENKSPPRQRKILKKQSAAPAKPKGTKAAAKSRLAAVKAAMKAKQQVAEAERTAKEAGNSEEKGCLNSEETQFQGKAKIANIVTFDGGFFKVESPAKQSGLVRRSSHLSATVLPQASPSVSHTPRRITRQSLALAQTPVPALASPPQSAPHNPHHCLTLDQTPSQASQLQCSNKKEKSTVNVSLCFSPVKEAFSDETQAAQSETVSAQDNTATVPELGTPISVHSLPPISIAEEKPEVAEAIHLNISVCPTLSLSPCKTPSPASSGLEPTLSNSFTFSSYVTPSKPISFQTAVQIPVETQNSVCCTPNSSLVEEIPGLDFERYLQPSQRCNLSSRASLAIETPSPLAVDVEMESPREVSGVPSGITLRSPQVCPAESGLLLFTPDVKHQICQSVCMSDLMVFTPPSNMQ